MARSFEQLGVFREKGGDCQRVGSIAQHDGVLSFSYDAAYLISTDAAALSLSLPLQNDPFVRKDARTRAATL